LVDWLSFGLDEMLFWDSTPYMVTIYLEAQKKKNTDKYNNNIHLAWHIVALDRQKKLKDVSKYLIGYKKPVLSGAEKIAAMEQFRATLPKISLEQHIANVQAKRNPQ